MAVNIGGGGDVGNGDGGGDKVVTFPTTPEERRALRKAKQDRERQRLVNVFIDEAGGDQALFRASDNIAYADLIIAGHRETWPVRSIQFRHAYVRYLRQRLDRYLDTEPIMALVAKAATGKAAVNAALDDFETRAICSSTVRDVHVRVAEHNGDIYIDMANADWHAIRVTPAGCGLRMRRLFKDTEETLFRSARPIAFEGISNVVTRPDLQDRSVIMKLESLSEFVTERELRTAFKQQHAGVLGALLDMMVCGLANLPTTKLVKPPRMADFATWAVACGVERFEEHYAANRANAIQTMLAFDPLAEAIRALMMARRGAWRGVMRDLVTSSVRRPASRTPTSCRAPCAG